MRHHFLSLSSLALAAVPLAVPLTAPLAAQIPVDSAVLLEDTPLTTPSYRLLDVLGRGGVQVREQSTFLPVTAVAVDPGDSDSFWFIGAASSLPGTWRSTMRELAEIEITVWGPWSQQPAQRLAIEGTRIATLQGTTLELTPKAGGTPLAVTVPDALDVALLGDLVYLAGSNGDVVERDLLTGQTRTVGTVAGLTAVAVSPFGNELCVGTSSGEVRRIDAATGTTTTVLATGGAPIVAVAFARFGTAVWTDGTDVWSEIAGSASIYTSPFGILDLDVAQADTASAVPYGTGCAAAAAARWNVPGVPTVGAPGFSLGVSSAPASSLTLLAVGGDRRTWTATGAPLPFDLTAIGAAGCSLLVDPQTVVTTATDATGSASVPLPIPNAPALVGVGFVGQWFVPDANVGALGLAASEAAAFVIG